MSNCNNYVPNTCPACPQGCPDLFEEVVIPAVLGDDSPRSNVKPENGAYKNKIVKYAINGHVYMYDSNGVPIPIKGKDGASSGVFRTTELLSHDIDEETVITLISIDRPITDIIVGETIIWDKDGTIGLVTAAGLDDMVVTTMSAVPSMRPSILLGSVERFADIPKTVAEAEALGFLTPVIGDTLTVRNDETHGDAISVYAVHTVEENGDITWNYDHSLNVGDYQLKSEGVWDGKLLTAGPVDGEFGEPIDPADFVKTISVDGEDIPKDENGNVDIKLPESDVHYVIRVDLNNIESEPETELLIPEASVVEVIKKHEVITLQDFLDNVFPNKDIVIIHGTKTNNVTNEFIAQFVDTDGTDMKFYVLVDTKGSNKTEVYKTSAVLTIAIDGLTTISAATTGKAIGDFFIDKTLVYDAAGTVAVVRSIEGQDIKLRTVTNSGALRQGVRIGAVDTDADLPETVTDAEEAGFVTPVVGDYINVRKDATHDDKLAVYLIKSIDDGGFIEWIFDHIINDGDYQEQSTNDMTGKLLVGGTQGTFGEAIDVTTFIKGVKVNDEDLEQDAEGKVNVIVPIQSISIDGEEQEIDDDGNVDLPKYVKTVSVDGTDIPQDEEGNVDLPPFVKTVSVDGEDIPQDENGNVDLPPFVKTVSVDGTDIPQDEDGNVDLPPFVKTVSIDGEDVPQDEDGNVDLPKCVKTVSVDGTDVPADDDGNVDLPPFVKTVSVDGTDVPQDENGNVDLPPFVKTVSVDGTDIPQDEDGNIDLPPFVKTISVNGVDVPQDEDGNVDLTIEGESVTYVIKMKTSDIEISLKELTSLNVSDIDTITKNLKDITFAEFRDSAKRGDVVVVQGTKGSEITSEFTSLLYDFNLPYVWVKVLTDDKKTSGGSGKTFVVKVKSRNIAVNLGDIKELRADEISSISINLQPISYADFLGLLEQGDMIIVQGTYGDDTTREYTALFDHVDSAITYVKVVKDDKPNPTYVMVSIKNGYVTEIDKTARVSFMDVAMVRKNGDAMSSSQFFALAKKGDVVILHGQKGESEITYEFTGIYAGKDTDNFEYLFDVVANGAGGGSSDVSLVEMTQTEYNALPAAQKQDSNIAYFVENPDETGEELAAKALAKALAKEIFDDIYPIGSYSFGVMPTIGTWEEVVGDRALWVKNTVDDGTTIAQALPNVTGTIAAYTYNTGSPTGVFTVQSTNPKQAPAGGDTDRNFVRYSFNASSNNSIYQNGANVQPNAYVMKVFKRIA